MTKIGSKFPKLSTFFYFCTNHERSNFGIKKSSFFSRKIAKIYRISIFFRMFLKKLIEPKLQPIEAPPGEFFLKVRNCQNSSNFVDFSQIFWIWLRPHRVSFLKSEKWPKFFQFRRFFTIDFFDLKKNTFLYLSWTI